MSRVSKRDGQVTLHHHTIRIPFFVFLCTYSGTLIKTILCRSRLTNRTVEANSTIFNCSPINGCDVSPNDACWHPLISQTDLIPFYFCVLKLFLKKLNKFFLIILIY